MTEILNGETSLQFACKDGESLSLNVSDSSTETAIQIDGEISLDTGAEGECDLQTQINGVVETMYISDTGGYEKYAGPYEVTPKADDQILSTKRKVMENDVTVRSIPTYEVSNESGGTTFYIADIGG